jgi:hypothetical protein
LLLATGKIFKPPFGSMAHAHLLQGFKNLGSIGSPRPPDGSHVSIPTHHHHVEHGKREAFREVDPLGDIPDRLAVLPRWAVEERYLSPVWLQDPQKEPKDGRLPGAVGPNEGGERAGWHFQRNPLEDRSGSV